MSTSTQFFTSRLFLVSVTSEHTIILRTPTRLPCRQCIRTQFQVIKCVLIVNVTLQRYVSRSQSSQAGDWVMVEEEHKKRLRSSHEEPSVQCRNGRHLEVGLSMAKGSFTLSVSVNAATTL